MTSRYDALVGIYESLLGLKEEVIAEAGGTGSPVYNRLMGILDYVRKLQLDVDDPPVYWLIVEDKVDGWVVKGPWPKEQLINCVQTTARSIKRLFIFEGGARIQVSAPPNPHMLFPKDAVPIYKIEVSEDTTEDGLIDNQPAPSGKPAKLQGQRQGDEFG